MLLQNGERQVTGALVHPESRLGDGRTECPAQSARCRRKPASEQPRPRTLAAFLKTRCASDLPVCVASPAGCPAVLSGPSAEAGRHGRAVRCNFGFVGRLHSPKTAISGWAAMSRHPESSFSRFSWAGPGRHGVSREAGLGPSTTPAHPLEQRRAGTQATVRASG